eukprot:TRINITY_DN1600_c0_g1_i1.p2 TRINITY_DN1600_c0_g1~~TRINITY_DN1600_c0_g1_i1.p2  ORF type:complete len:149 (-),score=1.39 TRINITY_DN1600_c0_g1_i1:202-648(-)
MSKRLQKELSEFMANPQPEFKVELAKEDNLLLWRAEVLGPAQTPYEGGKFHLEIDVPAEYPFKPPKVKFQTKIYHPNVKSDGGFCTDILTTEGWSPQLKLQQVLMTVREILREPNPDNPLEADIANQYKTDRNAFTKTAKDWTKKYAS